MLHDVVLCALELSFEFRCLLGFVFGFRSRFFQLPFELLECRLMLHGSVRLLLIACRVLRKIHASHDFDHGVVLLPASKWLYVLPPMK